MRSIEQKGSETLLWIGIFLILTSVFYMEGLGFHDREGIMDFTGQSKVFSRIIKSSQEGIFSSGGLLGFCLVNGEIVYRITRENFTAAFVDCSEYQIYRSQSGGQAMLYSMVYKVYPDLGIFELFCGALLSLVIVCWLMWISRVFGLPAAIMSFLGIITLRHLVFLGDNINLVLGCNLMIFIGLLWALEKKSEHLGMITGILFLVKYFMNGA